ncbi:unnamed protein product, partial [Rotaria socialis]
AQLLAPNRNERQLDVDIENMKRDPNTRIVQRPPQEDIVYKQRVNESVMSIYILNY